MLKRKYAFLISIAVLALVLLPTSCTCSSSGEIPDNGLNPGGIGIRDAIAFVSNRDGNNEIYVMNTDGSLQTRLTNHPLPDISPTWSPDSSKVTFTSYSLDEEIDEPWARFYEDPVWLQTSYCIINADGSNQTNIPINSNTGGTRERSEIVFDDLIPANGFVWSTDSDKLFFINANYYDPENPTIYTIDADGSNPTILTGDNTSNDEGDSSSTTITININLMIECAWSPDRTQIAFLDTKHNFYTMNTDGTNNTLIFDMYRDNTLNSLVWDPDGHNIVYDRNGVIWTIKADGSKNAELTDKYTKNFDAGGYWSNSNPVWSPDGEKIAFESFARENSESPINHDIWVMDADGSDQIRLTNNPSKDYSPTWSPDSSKIAFVSQRNGNAEIYVMNADGTGQTRLTNNPADDTDPAWAP